jgi:hypothetical protein
MARDARISQRSRDVGGTIAPLARAFAVERVTRIELAWPAWKAGALPLSYTRVVEHGVGATGLEPAIFCSQSRRASHYATPRAARAAGVRPTSVGQRGAATNQHCELTIHRRLARRTSAPRIAGASVEPRRQVCCRLTL